MKITCDAPPALVTLSGKRYVVPLWLEVPPETTLEDIEWSRPARLNSKTETIVREEYVTGSTGNEYLVKLYSNGTGTCECWGYKRHKKCKHIRGLKNEKI